MDKNAKALRGWEATAWPLSKWRRDHAGTNGESQTEDVSSAKGSGACQSDGFQQQRKREDSTALKHHFDRYGRPSVPLWVNLGKSKSHRSTMHQWTTPPPWNAFGLTEMYSSSTYLHPTHPIFVNFRVMRGSSPSCSHVMKSTPPSQRRLKRIRNQFWSKSHRHDRRTIGAHRPNSKIQRR